MSPSRPQTESPFPLFDSFSPSGSCPTLVVRGQRRSSHFPVSSIGRAITAARCPSLSFTLIKMPNLPMTLLCVERTRGTSRTNEDQEKFTTSG